MYHCYLFDKNPSCNMVYLGTYVCTYAIFLAQNMPFKASLVVTCGVL
jgi:uncharacterized MAPEG superfamily protein